MAHPSRMSPTGQHGSVDQPIAQVDPRTLDPLSAYLVDAAQRTILYWDVMRQRGNQYREHMAQQAPNVLHFGAELIMRRAHARAAGQLRPRPHHAARRRHVDQRNGRSSWSTRAPATAPASAASRPTARSASRWPPAIRATSSASCRSGPRPDDRGRDGGRGRIPRQVISLHPQADGKPVVIGNCQGGWAAMMLAAATPGPVRRR